jgi:flagellar protein FlaG
MQVEALTSTGTTLQQPPKAAESVDGGRKALEKGKSVLLESSASAANSVQPEEILDQIKALTENGLYSVRFENNQEFDELIVKVVDNETNEVIRQVPAEEILGMKASLAELRGKIVNTVR